MSPSQRIARDYEQLRRSVAMLQPGAPALDREDAMVLLADLDDLDTRLRRVKEGLRSLVDEAP